MAHAHSSLYFNHISRFRAQVVKLQRSFLVDDRVLVFTEAKQHVDNCKVQEMPETQCLFLCSAFPS